jgi:hypothetical protein
LAMGLTVSLSAHAPSTRRLPGRTAWTPSYLQRMGWVPFDAQFTVAQVESQRIRSLLRIALRQLPSLACVDVELLLLLLVVKNAS